MEVNPKAKLPGVDWRLTPDEYEFIFRRVPRLCVDIVVIRNGGVLFAKREIEPFKGFWTLPGGMVRYRESVEDALKRILKNELGVTLAKKKLLGVVEHMNDGPWLHSVSLAFLVQYRGRIRGSGQGREFRIISDFSEKGIQPYQAAFLHANPPALAGRAC